MVADSMRHSAAFQMTMRKRFSERRDLVKVMPLCLCEMQRNDQRIPGWLASGLSAAPARHPRIDPLIILLQLAPIWPLSSTLAAKPPSIAHRNASLRHRYLKSLEKCEPKKGECQGQAKAQACEVCDLRGCLAFITFQAQMLAAQASLIGAASV